MSDILSNLEREFVLQYFKDLKPAYVIKNVDTRYIPGEAKLPSFQPMKIEQDSYFIENDIIVLPRKKYSRVLADKSPIVIFFYFKGRALTFETVYCHIPNGFAFKIEKQIFKVQDTKNVMIQDLTCKISSGDFNVQCFTNDNFSVFEKADIKKLQSRFYSVDLTDPFAAISSRVYPPVVLNLNAEKLIIGVNGTFISFYAHQVYDVEIIIPQAIIERKIIAKCECIDFHTDETNFEKVCYEFSFVDLKMEDHRFLHDKVNH